MPGLRTFISHLVSRPGKDIAQKLIQRDQVIRNLRNQLSAKDREIASLKRNALKTSECGVHDTGSPMPLDDRFFVIGRARSGTTWLRRLLNSHPEILCWGEGRFFERSFRRQDFSGWKEDNVVPVSLYGALCDNEDLRNWIDRSVWSQGLDTDEHIARIARMSIDYFMGFPLPQSQAKIAGDKTPYVRGEVVEEIKAVFPEAKVINIVRDGRDATVSLVHHMWNFSSNEGGVYELHPEELRKRDDYRSGNLIHGVDSLFTKERLADIASEWNREVGAVVEKAPKILEDNYREVRYEDLLQSPEAEIGKLFEFLDVDNSIEIAAESVRKTGFERNAKRQKGEEDSSSRMRKGVMGDWRNVFTENDRRIFKEHAGSLLVKLGYEEDNDW